MPLGEWNRRLGALPAEAYHASWSGSLGPNRLHAGGARVSLAHQAGSPRIISRAVPRSPDHAAVFTSVKDKPPAGAEEAAPSLTAVARVGFGSLAVGAEESLRRGRTKERIQGKEERKRRSRCGPLTRKAPYKPYPDRRIMPPC